MVCWSPPTHFLNVANKQIIALAARNALPTIYEFREYAEIGGLASYGSSPTEAFHQASIYAGNILGGAKIADFPTVQTTKFEFAINLKTAKVLGLEISPTCPHVPTTCSNSDLFCCSA